MLTSSEQSPADPFALWNKLLNEPRGERDMFGGLDINNSFLDDDDPSVRAHASGCLDTGYVFLSQRFIPLSFKETAESNLEGESGVEKLCVPVILSWVH